MSKDEWRRPRIHQQRRRRGEGEPEEQAKIPPIEKDVFVKYSNKKYEYDPDDLDDEYDDR